MQERVGRIRKTRPNPNLMLGSRRRNKYLPFTNLFPLSLHQRWPHHMCFTCLCLKKRRDWNILLAVHFETYGNSRAQLTCNHPVLVHPVKQIDAHLAHVMSAPDAAVDFGGLESNGRGATAIGGRHFVVEVCTSQGHDRWKEVRERVSCCHVVGRPSTLVGVGRSRKRAFWGSRNCILRFVSARGRRSDNVRMSIPVVRCITLSVVSGMEGHDRDGASENAGGRSGLPFQGATDKLRGSRRTCQRVRGEIF